MSICLALILIAGLLAVPAVAIAGNRRAWVSTVVYGASLSFALGLLATGVAGLTGAGGDNAVVLPLGIPWLGAHFRIDALSAFFLVVVNLGAAAASLYAIGYGRHEQEPERILPFYPVFLAGMNLVLLADDAFTFLLSWESMSLASWALVMAHHREADNRHAGFVYLVMASAGTMALLLAFGLLAGPGGGYGFATIRAAEIAPVASALVLGLVLVGAGSKAGLIPLHVWLPLAHPAAPSHVSALMSGVMTKVAIYAFLRIVLDLLGSPEWWWATLVLGLGAATAVGGLLYAVSQGDLKRLLAYSTVENVGVIFIAIGLALAFEANGMAAGAALAMTACLFHILNHSLFKSLLFLGAGAVLSATGERDLERLGGLIHRMPQTAVAFLVGCVAISALPPLNGFVSEWLIFQAILIGPELQQWDLKILVPAVGAMLALSAALAAACFVKAFGVGFLGRPRSPGATAAREVDGFSRAAMFVCAFACLLAGLFPGFVIDALAPSVASLVGARMPVQAAVPWLSIVPVSESRSSYNGFLVFLFIGLSASIAAFAIHRLASHALRRAPPWDCGFPDPSPATQYTAGSFAQPIRRVFGTVLFRARESVDMPAPGDLRPARFAVNISDIVWETLYRPVAGGVAVLSERFNRYQFLTIRRYLSVVFAALVALLLVLAIWQ